MVNESHLEILKQGVEVWNKWREDHPEMRPDLRDAILPNAILPYATLSKANLEEANLSNADLSNAILPYATLSKRRPHARKIA